MWAVFPERLQKKIEERSMLKKTFIRVLTLSFALGVIFSSISYKFSHYLFIKFHNYSFLSFVIIIALAMVIGGMASFLVFSNMFIHFRRIIYELSTENPRWDWLEQEYIESDIRSSYLAIKKLHLTVSSQARLIGIAQIASQVAHDIRSPLVALDVVIKDIKNIPENQRILIKNAIIRINDIANNLLFQYKQKNCMKDKEIKNALISDLIFKITSEKIAKYKYKDIRFLVKIDSHAQGNFSEVSSSAFNRVLSNIIDNAVEAQASEIKIQLKLKVKNDMIFNNLIIDDNGCGISEEILDKIISGENISNKPEGFGLGLSSAIKLIRDEWKGELDIESYLDKGTSINIILPKTSTPNWFLSELNLNLKNSIVIVDDDESIHQVWLKRFNEIHCEFNFFHYYSPKQILSHCINSNDIFLVDHEYIGFKKDGISLIKELNIINQAYLVTNRYDDNLINKACNEVNLKIIPKTLAPFIPILVQKNEINTLKKVDFIFIDDDISITGAWVLHGIAKGKKVLTYNSILDFQNDITKYSLCTPIFIDSDLQGEIKGQYFAKELYEKGFKNIYLATGSPSRNFPDMYWIKEIVGKEPPF